MTEKKAIYKSDNIQDEVKYEPNIGDVSIKSRLSVTSSMAVADKNIPDGVYRTYAALGVHTNKEGWCYPSLRRLAEIRGVSRAAISQHLKWLRQHGYINTQSRYKRVNGVTKRLTNIYQVKLDFDPNDNADGVYLSSELNTPLSSELNTLLSSELNTLLSPELNVNESFNALPKDISSKDESSLENQKTKAEAKDFLETLNKRKPTPKEKERKQIESPGIDWAVLEDRKVTEADIDATRGDTLSGRLETWKTSENIKDVVRTFSEEFGILPPDAGSKHYHAWLASAKNLTEIGGKGDLLHTIRQVARDYNGFDGIKSPHSIESAVYKKRNEMKKVEKKVPTPKYDSSGRPIK